MRLFLLVLLASSGCQKLDLDEPVIFVPDGLETEVRDQLESALACWNRGFGTDFRIGGDGSQRVQVFFDDQVCLHAAGAYQVSSPRAVALCRDSPTNFGGRYFNTILHELGHVANIYTHAKDDAVMNVNEVRPDGSVVFTATDRELFADANPDFEATAECELILDDALGVPSCECL